MSLREFMQTQARRIVLIRVPPISSRPSSMVGRKWPKFFQMSEKELEFKSMLPKMIQCKPQQANPFG